MTSPQERRAMADREHTAHDFLMKVARVASAIGRQACVGGMETAGSLISYLARFPEKLDRFMADDFSTIDDLPDDWFRQGCLTWHSGTDGSVVDPEFARRDALIRNMERKV